MLAASIDAHWHLLHADDFGPEPLEAPIADSNTAQKHVWPVRIVLLSAAGHGTHAIMREAGVAKTAVWRWQERFAQEGVNGLLRDKTWPSRIPPLGPECPSTSWL